MTELVAINGEIFSPQDAKISVFDRGFLFGDAVYEVTRSYDRILFQLEDHLERLTNSADKIGLNLGRSREQAIDLIYKLYKKLDAENVYFRIQVTRGDGPIGMSSRLTSRPNEVIFLYPYKSIPEKCYTEGVDIAVVDRLRNSKKALDPNIKSGNYLNNVLAFMEGEKINAFETVMVNDSGQITEGTTANIFYIKNKTFVTPPETHDILKGITRKIVRKLIQDMNLNYEEKGFTLKELAAADEVFLTSSTREIVPVKTINTEPLAGAPGPLTRQLHSRYKEFINQWCERAKLTHPWR